ncbi:MAG: hypothetical protein M3Y26_06975 [Actinomycetota bacterium]|nr:hypothetical protein [Actinomycetota bacterium]
MTAWLTAAPWFVLVVAIVLVPGLAIAYAAGLRGPAGWGVAPALGMTSLTLGTVLAPFLGLVWTPWYVVPAALIGVLVALATRWWSRPRALPSGASDARGHPRADPTRTRWTALAGAAVGTVTVLVAAVPGMGSPGELVDSTDVVAHLNRIRQYLSDGNLSSLGSGGKVGYPSGFHDVAVTAAQLVPHLAAGDGIVTAANLTALAAAAVVWPLGLVALARLSFGRSSVVLLSAGLVAGALTTFPYILMGWGVLWPNLFATALLPGVLGPALVAVGVVGPVAGLNRRGAVAVTIAALPGLTLTHPNALVSLVMLVVLAFGTRLLLLVRLVQRGSGVGRQRAAALLATLVIVVVTGLLAAPRLSRQVADTASYDWGASEPFGESLRDVALLGLQVDRMPWGLLVFIALGVVVCARVVRLRWVLVGWVTCILLFLVAATGRPGWGAIITGYWYNDKVRLAALAAVPTALLAVAGTQWSARLVERALTTFSPPARRTTRQPRATRATAVGAALVLLLLVTGGANHDKAYYLVDRYYHPPEVTHRLLSPTEEAQLGRLAALIPPGVVTTDVPANGSAFLYAFFDRPVLFDSLLLDPDPDSALIGLHLKVAATNTQVCDALRRKNVQYAVTGAVRYWLSLSDRTSGMAALGGVDGFEQVGAAGRYRLYRIRACGFDPSWLPARS